VKLDVHAFERLLHLLNLAGRADEMVAAQPLVVLQLPDVSRRHEAAAQQSMRVQGGQPLAVGHVGLATGHILHVPAIDHHHRQTGRLQHLIEVEPVNPVASIATEHTPCSLNQAHKFSSSPVNVPKTLGRSPAMETWSFSLPTSMLAALGSRTDRAFMIVSRVS